MPSAAAVRPFALRATAVLGASAAIAFAAGCGGSDSGSSAGSGSSGSGQQIQASTGKDIFSESGCTSCHTLADAGSQGNIGPNLDESKPPKEEVVEKVTNGDGRMPAYKDRLTTEQINTVAEYVSSVAGK